MGTDEQKPTQQDGNNSALSSPFCRHLTIFRSGQGGAKYIPPLMKKANIVQGISIFFILIGAVALSISFLFPDFLKFLLLSMKQRKNIDGNIPFFAEPIWPFLLYGRIVPLLSILMGCCVFLLARYYYQVVVAPPQNEDSNDQTDQN